MLTVKLTGFPSVPATRAWGPVSCAATLNCPHAGGPQDDDDVLIAAVAARDVVRAYLLATGLHQVSEHPVTQRMTVHVVDLLEVVHVDHQRDQRLDALGDDHDPELTGEVEVVRTIVRKLALLAIGLTRDMSSFSSSIGQPPRLSSEAKPVPKSSRATRTPISAS
jgi:hypothetical protein